MSKWIIMINMIVIFIITCILFNLIKVSINILLPSLLLHIIVVIIIIIINVVIIITIIVMAIIIIIIMIIFMRASLHVNLMGAVWSSVVGNNAG